MFEEYIWTRRVSLEVSLPIGVKMTASMKILRMSHCFSLLNFASLENSPTCSVGYAFLLQFENAECKCSLMTSVFCSAKGSHHTGKQFCAERQTSCKNTRWNLWWKQKVTESAPWIKKIRWSSAGTFGLKGGFRSYLLFHIGSFLGSATCKWYSPWKKTDSNQNERKLGTGLYQNCRQCSY